MSLPPPILRPLTGWGDAVRRIVAEEGVVALTRGIGARVTWLSIGGAVFIGSFEELRRRLGPRAAGHAAG